MDTLWQRFRSTWLVRDDDQDDDEDKPTGYLYGDLELQIINTRWSENHAPFFFNYSGSENSLKSVDIAIRLYRSVVACSKFTLDDSRFAVSLAHPIESNLEVRFKLEGECGVATLPCRDIDAYNEFKRWFPITGRHFFAAMKQWLKIEDNNKQYIEVQLQVKFTPCTKNPLYKGGIGAEYALKESFFPLRDGGKVTLYQDAHYASDPTEIPLENGTFKPGACWEDICKAIFKAKHVVYIIGWLISHKVRLVRETTMTRLLSERGLETLGELLKYKARQGVKVRLLVWNDRVGIIEPLIMTGNTNATETKLFFEKEEGVECELVQRNLGGERGFLKEKMSNLIFSHNQKCVVVDDIIAFIGGLDLCSGRYDTPEHRLYDGPDTVFQDDFFNPTFQSSTSTNYPREPWHDLHCKIEGPAVHDVLKNFQQRWQEVTKKESKDHVLEFDNLSSCDVPNDQLERWNVQIFRSIDSGSVKEFPTFYPTKKEALILEENVIIDRSIQMAYIQAIRCAQHFVYIENQYFIGSLPNQNMGTNLIPLELALKIASKIKSNERFCVYIVIPMYPEGQPQSKVVQKMLYLQWQTMQMMYQIIAQEIKSTELKDAHPTDYLNFYCLGKRETPPQDEVNNESLPSQKYKRFMIYVHSKGMIVDDAYVILGSANINHRSMDGSGDTEIAMGSYQPHYTWTTEKKHPCGQIYGYRISIWDEHFGLIDNRFKDPKTLECVKYVNHVAEKNWKKYSTDQFHLLQGHILKYPVGVDVDGYVTPIDGHKTFPDTNGNVLGAPIFYIPEQLIG